MESTEGLYKKLTMFVIQFRNIWNTPSLFNRIQKERPQTIYEAGKTGGGGGVNLTIVSIKLATGICFIFITNQ